MRKVCESTARSRMCSRPTLRSRAALRICFSDAIFRPFRTRTFTGTVPRQLNMGEAPF